MSTSWVEDHLPKWGDQLNPRERGAHRTATLKELEAERRAELRALRSAQRHSIEVLARDTMWAIDATHLGRDDQGAGSVDGAG